jgi:RNA polymerase sigma factor (sigma-70 family)
MVYEALPDELLISLYYLGNRQALDALAARHRPALVRFFQKGVVVRRGATLVLPLPGYRNVETCKLPSAGDLAQVVLLAVTDSKPGGKIKAYDSAQGSFKTWVYWLAGNKLLDLGRKLGLHGVQVPLAGPVGYAAEEDSSLSLEEILPDTRPIHRDEDARDNEKISELRARFLRLVLRLAFELYPAHPRQFLALVLIDFDRQDYKDVAAVCGIPSTNLSRWKGEAYELLVQGLAEAGYQVERKLLAKAVDEVEWVLNFGDKVYVSFLKSRAQQFVEDVRVTRQLQEVRYVHN